MLFRSRERVCKRETIYTVNVYVCVKDRERENVCVREKGR